jgi:sulfotransferase
MVGCGIARAPRPRATILPPDLFKRYSCLAFWRDLQKSKFVRIAAQNECKQADAMPEPTQRI